MNHLTRATCIVVILGLHAHSQDAYINGHQWYGHEVDLCYIDFDKIRDQGDPAGAFAYAKIHLQTMTHFEYGEPVSVLRTRIVQPDDLTLVLVRRFSESKTYWTDPTALSSVDPFAQEKAETLAARVREGHAKATSAREQFKLEQQRKERSLAASESPHVRPPIAIQRYWQIGTERFRGKLVNANATHAKILKIGGETIVVNRQHLSETSNSYVGGMLRNLATFHEYQAMISRSI